MTSPSNPSQKKLLDLDASQPRRWLHLWLPQLSIDRVMRSSPPPSSPLALIAKRDNTLRLEALDAAAEALGLETGLPLATARSRVPELTVVEADPEADKALLAVIGEACRRYTPALALDPPDGVHLDITGAAALFGGERALTDEIAARMDRQGLMVRMGVARTLGLAWALSRHGGGRPVKSVRQLPVTALRLDADSIGVLHRLGLRQVGQILDIPRPALARRLGEVLLDRLDEILGFKAVALDLAPEPARFYVQHRLAEPIALETQVLRLCAWLAGRLTHRLERQGLGGRLFALELFRVDGACKRLTVQAGRPLRHPDRIAALFTERLAVLNDGLEADFGFDLLRLTAEIVEPMALETTDFLGAADDGNLATLIDRLSVRLGPQAVHRLVPSAESRIPERAVKTASCAAASTDVWAEEAPARYDDVLLRPFTLFSPPQPITAIAGVPEDPPQQFTWRRLAHRIVRAEGPERIAWEWWREKEPPLDRTGEAGPSDAADPASGTDNGLPGDPVAAPDRRIRDYYRLEDEAGRRFWVFREGAFDSAAAPRWFLHGLFP